MAAEVWAQSDGEDSFLEDAIGAVRSIELAARLLRIAAIVGTAIWVGTVATAFYIWDQTEQLQTSLSDVGFSPELDEDFGRRVSQTVSSTVSATWGYALVAIVALAGWLYAESRRASVFLDALDEVDEMRSAPTSRPPAAPPTVPPAGPTAPPPFSGPPPS